MSGVLLDKADIQALAARQAVIRERVPVAALSRLSALVNDDEGEVTVRIAVSLPEDSVVLIDGSVQADLQFTCQRCLDPLETSVDANFRIAVADAERDDFVLPEGFEAAQADIHDVRLVDIVEDELLLVLPLAPMHEPASRCGPLAEKVLEYGGSDAATETQNPFAILRQLKKH